MHLKVVTVITDNIDGFQYELYMAVKGSPGHGGGGGGVGPTAFGWGVGVGGWVGGWVGGGGGGGIVLRSQPCGSIRDVQALLHQYVVTVTIFIAFHWVPPNDRLVNPHTTSRLLCHFAPGACIISGCLVYTVTTV